MSKTLKVLTLILAALAGLIAITFGALAYAFARAAGKSPLTFEIGNSSLSITFGRPRKALKAEKPEKVEPEAPEQEPAPAHLESISGRDEKKLVGALTNLGYTPKDAKGAAKTLRGKLGREPLADVLKEAIQLLSAA